jgi:hypothetical protein
MTRFSLFPYRRGVCAALILFAQQAFAEEQSTRSVRILDGAPPAESAPQLPPPSMTSAPEAPEKPAPEAAQSTSPTALPPSANDARPQKPAPVAVSTAPVDPQVSSAAPETPVDLGSAKLANPAEVAIEMQPGQTLSVGSRVTFHISTRKGGYLVLIDVDANGKLTQIYPNTTSLMRVTRPNGNYIKPGGSLIIPLATDPYGGFEYVVSPPSGRAMVVAVLSPEPVQILDLPDIPDVSNQLDALARLAKSVGELRIPDGNAGRLREAKWSFDAKAYTIQ